MSTVKHAGKISPQKFKPLIPHDSAASGECRGSVRLHIGTAGNLAVVDLQGNTVVMLGMTAGNHDIQVDRVNATSTTAANITALYVTTD